MVKATQLLQAMKFAVFLSLQDRNMVQCSINNCIPPYMDNV